MEHNHAHHEGHDHHGHHPHHNQKNNLAIPIAIVIAGAFIAGAIFFTNQGPKVQTLDSVMSKIAKMSGVSPSKFNKCLEAGTFKQAVSDSVQAAAATGGNGTPWSIIVGPTGKKYPLSGAQPIDKVRAMVDLALKDAPAPKSDALDKMLPVTDKDHIKGDINAPVKIVEYSDLECPFCKRFHSTLQEVVDSYDGQVAWVFRQFPLAQLHPKAVREAEAAECVASLGGNTAFWKFIDKINEVTPGNNKLDEAKI
jgi:protein-disulfide isomerase